MIALENYWALYMEINSFHIILLVKLVFDISSFQIFIFAKRIENGKKNNNTNPGFLFWNSLFSVGKRKKIYSIWSRSEINSYKIFSSENI